MPILDSAPVVSGAKLMEFCLCVQSVATLFFNSLCGWAYKLIKNGRIRKIVKK